MDQGWFWLSNPADSFQPATKVSEGLGKIYVSQQKKNRGDRKMTIFIQIIPRIHRQKRLVLHWNHPQMFWNRIWWISFDLLASLSLTLLLFKISLEIPQLLTSNLCKKYYEMLHNTCSGLHWWRFYLEIIHQCWHQDTVTTANFRILLRAGVKPAIEHPLISQIRYFRNISSDIRDMACLLSTDTCCGLPTLHWSVSRNVLIK